MSTGLKIQRAMFLENLWRQMDKMSAADDNVNIVKVANRYISDGYEDNEVVELLVDDGFEANSAKMCVSTIMREGTVLRNKWGFEAEDQRGDIANNFDLGVDGVPGDDQKVVWEDAQSVVDKKYPGKYTVTRVFAL